MAKEGKDWMIILIGIFADDYLVDITEEKIRLATGGVGVESWKKSRPAIFLPEGWKSDSQQGEPDAFKVLPLFVCEKIDDFRKCGLQCPYEFVVERSDLFDGDYYKATDALRKRIDILTSQEQSNQGIRLTTFKDWMSGVMRKYLFLDDTAHGISGYIDPKDPNWNWAKWFAKTDAFEKWKMRFAHGGPMTDDSLGYLQPLMKALWPKYFEATGDLSLTEAIEQRKFEKLNDIYNVDKSRDEVAPEMRLPLSQGDRSRFVTPTGKINVLLIDDDATNSVLFNQTTSESNYNWSTDSRQYEIDKINGKDKKQDYIEAWQRFDKIFTIQPFELRPENFPNFEKSLREILNSHLSYDFALVDLCFGEDPGNDPLGYHVIKKLSKLFPHMPIVVYSRYKDMGHIMRAFQCGAMWFLQKGEEQKLARHLMDVVKKGSWKREWRAMQEFRPVTFIYTGKDQAFDDKFRHTDEWQYLTAKSLEFFPGKFIEVKKMGGGISTASTFCVQKGLKLDGRYLQSPMIIKIDTAPNTRMEFERYFRYIRPYMANEAGRIENPCIIIDRNCSAIVYTFAGRQDKAHALDSMKNMLKADIVFKASCDYEKYRKAFDMIFDEILPKIHRVTPNREFGDGEENKHQEVFSHPAALDAKNAPGASFPNQQFGEVAEKDFYQTYLIRYPHFGKINLEGAAFVAQPTFEIKSPDESHNGSRVDIKNPDNVSPYEFHDVWKNDDGSIDLEVYDCEHDRKPYLLTGPIATHVARFRQQMYPGSILWVCGEKEEDCAEPGELRKCMFVERVEEDANWVKYANEYSAEDASKSECSGMKYFDLVDEVLRFCKALYGTIENNELEDFLWSDKNCKYLFKERPHEKVNGAKRFLEARKFFEHIRERFTCPIAICHGDLNYGNIMLESRKHPPKDEKPDVSQTITDAWLIDFAKTRRDMIAHDFNVMFTDTFGWLFDTRLFDADTNVKDAKEKYETRLNEILPRFIQDVMFAENPNPPDYLANDARFVFVYKILRRIRKAALGAGISEEMYTLTTVLECLLTLKLHLNKNMKNIRASAALFAVAKICFEHLCDKLELDLLSMGNDGKTNRDRKK